MRLVSCLFATGIALAFVPANAVAKDHTGYIAIAQGDFAKAERTLVAERRIFPERPALMINLATVYRHTGRTAQARALYRAVLDHPDMLMDMPGGATASSHALAQAGLGGIDATTVATRLVRR